MGASSSTKRQRAAILAAAFLLSGATARANPDMATDFQSITDWLSHEVAQGLGFNAGSAFDPPHEVTDRRLQPDLSLGVGSLPLDHARFPRLETQQLTELDPQGLFPPAVLFPNLVMHLRGGLPWRMDFAVRGANMTTPPGYKLTPAVAANGQSNSIGFGLRKHLFGGERPLLSLGANYNHVYGNFRYHTSFAVNDIEGFSANFPIQGALQWNVNSYGLDAVLSERFAAWTPFLGVGYNYLTGSVRAHLEADPQTDLVPPIVGESSQHPEESQGRLIFGAEAEHSWFHLFFNGEVKAIGIGAGQSWIVHAGMALPFHIGAGSGAPYASSSVKRRGHRDEPIVEAASPAMIFLQ